MEFSFNPLLWFICRSCKEVFPNTDELKNHKLKQHFRECLKIQCMVFEEQFVDNAWTPSSCHTLTHTQLSSINSAAPLQNNDCIATENDQHSHQAEAFQNPYFPLSIVPSTPTSIEQYHSSRETRRQEIQSLLNPQEEYQPSNHRDLVYHSQLKTRISLTSKKRSDENEPEIFPGVETSTSSCITLEVPNTNARVLKEESLQAAFPFSLSNLDNAVEVKSEVHSPLTEFDSNSGHSSPLRLTESEQESESEPESDSLSQAESDPLAPIEFCSISQTDSESNSITQEYQTTFQNFLQSIPLVTSNGANSVANQKATRKSKPKTLLETVEIPAHDLENETGLKPGSLPQDPNSNCSKELVTKVSQKTHSTSSSSLPCVCSICSASFPNKNALQKHGILHPSIKSFKCTHVRCVRAFRTEAGLKRHMREHTSQIDADLDSDSDLDHDVKCDVELPLLQWLRRQEEKNPANIILLDPDPHTVETFKPVDQANPVKCKWCQECFVSDLNLRLHVSKCFFFNKKKHRYCQECDRTFASPHVFRSHTRILHATLPRPSFKCSVCSKEFLNEKVFKFHSSTHNPPPESPFDRDVHDEPELEKNGNSNIGKSYFRCQFCDKAFINKASLANHERIHTGDKPFKCTVPNCGRAYGRKESLRHHQMGIHMIELGLQRFLCPTCGKGFPHRYLMNQHIQIIHAQEEPFKCTFKLDDGVECGKTFKYRNRMKVHVRVDHTGELPFQCFQCGKAYSRNGALNRHMQVTHEGLKKEKVTCILCPRKFKDNYEMKKHVMKIHETEKSFQCQLCGLVAGSKAYLTRHEKTHSNKNFLKAELRVDMEPNNMTKN